MVKGKIPNVWSCLVLKYYGLLCSSVVVDRLISFDNICSFTSKTEVPAIPADLIHSWRPGSPSAHCVPAVGRQLSSDT